MNEAAKEVIDVTKAHLGQGEAGVRAGVAKALEEKPIPLPDSPFEGFRMGANCDMRVRIAIDMLTHSPMFAAGKDVTGTPEETALFALDTATYLIDTAHERGLIKPWGEVADDKNLQSHMKRQVDWQVSSQKAAAKAAEEANRIHTAVHKAFNQ